MIVKVVHYFTEGRWSFYEGETFVRASIEEDRKIPSERVEHRINTGHLVVTEADDPVPPTAGDEAMDAILNTVTNAPLAEEGTSSTMPDEQPE